MTVADLLLDSVKAALDKTSTADDMELLDLLDAATAEYAEHVGPLPGTSTVRLSGGGVLHLLPRNVTAVTGATYTDGTTIDLTTLDLNPANGILYGPLSYGARNVTLTVTVGPLPPHHAHEIVADVAEYWRRTQRAAGGGRPSFGGDGFEPEASAPLVSWPRIRALAGTSIA